MRVGFLLFFFFQAEDGIRDTSVTGVQTCALPIFATVVACGILLSGCQRKAEGQTVAIVNGQEITVPDLNFALSQAKVPADADKNAVKAQVLQQLVDRRLLAEQARSEGIDKTPEFLNRQREAEEQLLITMLAARRLNTAQLPSDREAQDFIASHPGMFANRETWSLDQIQYSTPKDPAVIAEIQKTHSIDALIAVLQSHKIDFKRQKNRLDTPSGPPTSTPRFLNFLPANPSSFRFAAVPSAAPGRGRTRTRPVAA